MPNCTLPLQYIKSSVFSHTQQCTHLWCFLHNNANWHLGVLLYTDEALHQRSFVWTIYSHLCLFSCELFIVFGHFLYLLWKLYTFYIHSGYSFSSLPVRLSPVSWGLEARNYIYATPFRSNLHCMNEMHARRVLEGGMKAETAFSSRSEGRWVGFRAMSLPGLPAGCLPWDRGALQSWLKFSDVQRKPAEKLLTVKEHSIKLIFGNVIYKYIYTHIQFSLYTYTVVSITI